MDRSKKDVTFEEHGDDVSSEVENDNINPYLLLK